MIYIDFDTFEPPPEWLEKAQRAYNRIYEIEHSEEKKACIDSRSDLWRELKQSLFDLSHGKCWYCEAKEDRSDYSVDHFRPKKRVRHDDGTECDGYWWLAFDWRNFRLACDFCNSPHTREDGETLGKSDFFPILNEDCRAHCPDDNLEDEMPLLLDPVVPGDPELLWFMEDGKPYPAAREGTFPCERARKTIELLNLDDERVVEARKAVWVDCQRLIQRGDEAYGHYRQGSSAGMQKFRQVCQEIREIVSPEARYSATARAYLRSSTIEWVRALV